MTDADLATRVRLRLYDDIARRGAVPSTVELAAELGVTREDVVSSLQRLAAARVVVLDRGKAEVLMANPFSAVPTAFPVEVDTVRHFGNCAWDALGVPAILGRDAIVRASCGDCGEPLPIEVRAGRVRGDGIVHFAIPAKRWWDDIVFT